MHIGDRKDGNFLIVTPFEKRIDVAISTEFKGKMLDYIMQGNKRIILDLSSVDFIDSSGLGTIVSVMKTIDGQNGTFSVCCVKDTVMGLFNMTRMNRVFRIFADQNDAIKSLAT